MRLAWSPSYLFTGAPAPQGIHAAGTFTVNTVSNKHTIV